MKFFNKVRSVIYTIQGFLLIGGLIYAIFLWVNDNKTVALIILLSVIAIVAAVCVAAFIWDKRRTAAFFDKKRAAEEICAERFAMELKKADEAASSGGSEEFTAFKDAVEKAFASDDVVFEQVAAEKVHFDHNTGCTPGELAERINISPGCDPAGIYVKIRPEYGYMFMILPKVVYAFITGDTDGKSEKQAVSAENEDLDAAFTVNGRRFVFVAAYDPAMLGMKFGTVLYHRNYTFDDASHEPDEFFLAKLDIKDSETLSAGWRYKTANGTRDGRHKDNRFEVDHCYGHVQFEFGLLRVPVAFSNGAAVKELEQAWEKWSTKFNTK